MTVGETSDEQARARRRDGLARRKRQKTWVRRGVYALFALLVTAAAVAAWRPKPVPVDVATLAPRDMTVTVDDEGKTRVRDKYLVFAPLTGALARIELRAGDTVTAERVLATLVPLSSPLLDARSRAEVDARELAARAAKSQADAAVSHATLMLDHARQERQKDEALVASGSEPSQRLDDARLEERSQTEALSSAQFGAQVATHQLAEAQAAASRMRGPRADQGESMDVRSPTDGSVLRIIRASAGPVEAGAQLLEIGDPTKLEVVSGVLTSDAVKIARGARVTIDRWGGDEPLHGHVRVVEPSAFVRVSALGVEEQRVNVVIDLDEPHEVWSALGDGYRVDVHVLIWTGKDVLVAPAGAVFRHDGGWAAYVVDGGVARLRRVVVGKNNGAEVEVREGLRSGERVVLYPSDQVTDGVKVVVR